jgi:phosphoglycolate phosphatase
MNTAIIFDLDGTLADSTECVVQSAQNVGREAKLRTVSDDQIRHRIGEPLGPMLAALFGVEGKALDRLVKRYSEEYVALTATLERPFDGSIALLEALRSDGRKLAIATGKSQSGADNATRRMGLTPYFDSIHGIVPGTPGKPDPAVLQRAMAALGVTASNAIMIGDTTFDMDLARAIGVDAVAVSWGVHDVSLLRECGPRTVVDTMDELLSWLLAHT